MDTPPTMNVRVEAMDEGKVANKTVLSPWRSGMDGSWLFKYKRRPVGRVLTSFHLNEGILAEARLVSLTEQYLEVSFIWRTAVYPTDARWCEKTAEKLRLLLDYAISLVPSDFSQ